LPESPGGHLTKTTDLQFKVSVYLKDLIGRELVTNKQAAILELVKNSYDAYAPTVTVSFLGKGDGGTPDEIVVADSGKGMSPEEIKQKWMWVGYSDKRQFETEAPEWASGMRLRRTMAGYKGIGRFSCDKLGSVLDMYTKSNKGYWSHVHVDWGDFETDQRKEFQTVRAELDGVLPNWQGAKSLKHGTILRISGLRDPWAYDDLVKLRRWLERLRDPFNPHDSEFEISIDAPNFRIPKGKGWKGAIVNGPVRNFLSTELAQRTTMLSCRIGGGRIETSLLDKNRLIYKVVEDASKYKFLREAPTTIDIFYLSKAAKGFFTKRMGIEPVNYGSIMLYRNSFRVMPFGEPGDDWLGLERRRGQGFRRNLSSRELIGRVSIEDSSTVFEEVSSRSGGIKNEDALAQIKSVVVDKLLRRLERYVVGIIRWDSPKASLPAEKKGVKLLEVVTSLAGGGEGVIQITPGKKAIEAMREASQKNAEVIVSNLTALSRSEIGKEAQTSLRQNVSALRTALTEIKQEIRAREEELLFLESSEAKTGALVSILEHGFGIVNNKALPSVEKLTKEAVGRNLSKAFLDTLLDVKETLQMLSRMSQMASTAKFELADELVVVDVAAYVRQYLGSHSKEAMESWGMTLHVVGENVTFEKRTNVLALSVILDNFLDNSRKADAHNIYVKFEKKDNHLAILFSDDGDGVKAQSISRLFVPGYSTRGGTGLGLYSIKRLASMIQAKAEFVGNGVAGLGNGACFEVSL
jgi:signal transduction histidine kinase